MYFYIILEKRQVAVMVKFEIKKMFSKTVNRILFIVLIAITLIAGILTVRDERYVQENGDNIYGIKAARYLKDVKERWSGYLTEDTLKKVLKQNRNIDKTVKDPQKNFYEKQGFEEIRSFINLAFSGYKDYDYYKAESVHASEAGEFYNKRISRLKEYLDSGEENFSDAEKRFLIGTYERMETPLYYEYADGWKALMDSQYLLTLITIVVVITGFFVAGIFSDEFQLKADAVFFSAELGRNKAVVSKIAAGFLSITLVYWGTMLLYSAIVLFSLGFGGAGCAVQTGISNWDSIYNITYIQDYLLSLAGGYIGSLFILFFAMFVSVKSRSTVISITIPFVLSCAPMFLGRVPAFTRIMTLFPDQLLRINKGLEEFKLYEIGGKVFGYITIIIPLYLILFLVLIPVLYMVYKRAEIK